VSASSGSSNYRPNNLGFEVACGTPGDFQREQVANFAEGVTRHVRVSGNQRKCCRRCSSHGNFDQFDALHHRHGGSRLKSFFDTVEELNEISAARGGAVIGLPTFAFVDPFGFSDLPIASLCTLLRTGSCEVLFNFMYNDINRFFTFENEKHRKHLMMLFDFDEFPSVDGLGPTEREALLNQHIEAVFRRRGNFDYVRSFQMEGQTQRTLYSLFFATHRIEGLEIMKDVMWKIDPVEGRRFSDRVSDQLTLFEGEPDYGKLKRLVLERLAISSAKSPVLMDFVTVETDFRSAHLKSNVLKPLENEGVIVVASPNPNRRKGTFPEDCSIALA